MEIMDYGFHGDYKTNTQFWCYITDILHDGTLVVRSEGNNRVILESCFFNRQGNLRDHIHGFTERKTDGVISFCGTYSINGYLHTIGSGCTGAVDFYLKILADCKAEYERKNKAPTIFCHVPAFLTSYVTLVSIEDPAFFTGMGAFTVGVTYPIINGILVDENGECCADQITSVDDLNTRDKGVCTWEENPYESWNGYVFHDEVDKRDDAA